MHRSTVLLCALVFIGAWHFGTAQANGDVVAAEFFEDLFLLDVDNMTATDIYDTKESEPRPEVIVARSNQIFGRVFDEIYCFETATDTATLFSQPGFVVEDLNVDATGDFIAVDSDDGLFRIDGSTGQLSPIYSDPFFSPTSVDVAPSGAIYVTEFFDSLGVYSNGNYSAIGNFGPEEYSHVVVGNDGLLYATTTFEAHIHRIDPISGAATVISSLDFALHDDLEVADDGSLLVSGAYDLTGDEIANDGVFKIDRVTGQMSVVVSDIQYGPFFSPGDLAAGFVSTLDCDFDTDGTCNVADLNMLGVEVIAGTNDAGFDLTGDNLVDNADRDAWLAAAATENGLSEPYKLGDANLNGVVDGPDFVAWNDNKFSAPGATTPWSDADFNFSNEVNGPDFVLWNDNKFTSISDLGTVIPEPVTGLAWLLIALTRRRTMRN